MWLYMWQCNGVAFDCPAHKRNAYGSDNASGLDDVSESGNWKEGQCV